MAQLTAVTYARVSGKDQVNEGVSLEAQQTKLAAWCIANDDNLLAAHTDAGLCGGRADNRPALQAALKQACDSRSALVVYSLSRFARSTKEKFERDQIAERTRFAMSYEKSKGERVGTIPFGYDLAIDGVKLVENPCELGAVAAMHELRAQGWSYRRIAVEMSNRGFVSKGGSTVWSHTTIRSILDRASKGKV